MIKLINNKSLQVGAAFSAGMLMSTTAHAAGNNFSSIGSNIITSIGQLPGLLSGVAYMFGILLGVLGILKIKDHVENPGQTPLKDGAIRLAAGGGLFALPIIYEAMNSTIGTGTAVSAATLNAVAFGVN
jgi:hypothetical protein